MDGRDKPGHDEILPHQPLQLGKRLVGRVLAVLARDTHLVELARKKDRHVLAHAGVAAGRLLRVEANADDIAVDDADLAQRRLRDRSRADASGVVQVAALIGEDLGAVFLGKDVDARAALAFPGPNSPSRRSLQAASATPSEPPRSFQLHACNLP